MLTAVQTDLTVPVHELLDFMGVRMGFPIDQIARHRFSITPRVIAIWIPHETVATVSVSMHCCQN